VILLLEGEYDGISDLGHLVTINICEEDGDRKSDWRRTTLLGLNRVMPPGPPTVTSI
jgi:hypothetical protein